MRARVHVSACCKGKEEIGKHGLIQLREDSIAKPDHLYLLL